MIEDKWLVVQKGREFSKKNLLPFFILPPLSQITNIQR